MSDENNSTALNMTRKLEDFEVISVIGSGSFGTCYRVKCKLDNKEYVWKAIDYGKMNENKKQLLVSEVNLLSELRHPNIVRYYDRILHKETTTLYIIMECCQGGDLASVISSCKRNHKLIEEGFVWQVLYQTGRALQACHSHLGNVTVLHRDIKPANVFLDSDGNVKLGDFGLARILKNDEAYSDTMVGTPHYMSPELLRGGKYNRKSDIWALGCLVYEMCALIPPFFATSLKQLISNIKNGRFKRIPSYYSDDLHKIIEFMLSLNHEYRPTIEMILHHPTVVLRVSESRILKIIPAEMIKSKKSEIPVKEEKNEVKNVMVKKPDTVKEVNNEMKKLTLNDKEPESISERTFKEKWLTRLEAIRQKEASLRAKEESLFNKERILLKKEKHLQLLEKLAKDKVLRAEVYLRQCKESKSASTSGTNRHSRIPPIEEIDTSLSADPGDTSILPTSAKMDPLTLPKSFLRTTAERKQQKHVHFDTTLRQKLDRQRHSLCIIPSSNGSKESDRTSFCNKNILENKALIERNTVETFTEEKSIWLENKRFIYNPSEKENQGIESEIMNTVTTGAIKKKINKSVSSVFFKKNILNFR